MRVGYAVIVVLALIAQPARGQIDDDVITELPLPELQIQLAAGTLSAERVTQAFLQRIANVDDAGPQLNGIIETNPAALAIARELDRRFALGGVVGPLYGIPIVVKANIDTADAMATSAGSIALAHHYSTADAVVVERLRAAGAIIIAKANLSEWANFRSTRSISGWSSLGGQTRNPYVLDRSPCGSSSGSAVAVAARLAPLAIGTETDGSIVCPAGMNGVVGIKPTIGSVSQRGIVPVAASQDTAGPLARTVRDAALLLSVISDRGAGSNSEEIRRTHLPGLRLGVVRDFRGAGTIVAVEAAFGRSLAMLQELGAELVDPIELESASGADAAEFEVLLYEFKSGLNDYLTRVKGAPTSLEELIRFNADHATTVMPHFGQDILVAAQSKGALTDAAYRAAANDSLLRMRARLASVFSQHDLDLLIAPANGRAGRIDWRGGDPLDVSSSSIAAVSGYPSVVVPAEISDGLPLGLTFVGQPNDEALILSAAEAFELRRGEFPAPKFLVTIGE